MEKKVLIIDDQREQAEALYKALSVTMPHFSFEWYSEEDAIMHAIEHRFYTLAIVDLRMDKFTIDGIRIIRRIIEVNPFARVMILSAFREEYFGQLKDIFLSGKIVDFFEKEQFKALSSKLEMGIRAYYDNLDKNPSEINNALLQFYADAKNETDTYKKGERFEHFISLLFRSIGYKDISKRVIDRSQNEVDLVIRNEIDDSFLNKFGKYILIECKNKPDDGVSKNDLTIFDTKLENTNGLAELGIIATTGYIARTAYLEVLRTSGTKRKILFMSNPEIEQLIRAANKKEEFKRLIDSQVKDN